MRAILAALIASALGGGCYRPSVEACQLQCNHQQCPNGLACNEQGFCASSATAQCDSLPVDAPADADETKITIEVLDRTGVPLKGAVVVLADRAGAQIEEKVTGPDGIVTSDAVAGSSATVLRAVSDAAAGDVLYATTYLDLWGGAHLVSQPDPDARTRSVNIKWTPSAAANQYEIRTSCVAPPTTVPGGVTSFDVQIPTRCTTFDVVVFAGPQNTNPPPMSVVLGGQTGSSVVMPATWQSSIQVPATITGKPTNSSTLTSSIGGWITPAVPSTATFSSTTIDSGTPISPWRAPPGMSYTVQTAVPGVDPRLPNGTQTVIQRLAAGATSYTRNLDGILIPWTGNATFDRAAGTLSWLALEPQGLTTVATPNIVMAELGFTRGTARVVWRVIAPGTFVTTTVLNGITMATLPFPVVPGMRGLELTPNDQITVDHAITMHVADTAVHRVIELFEQRRFEITSYVPTIDHFTFSQTPSSSTMP
ncbi:MAG: hypothetical protein JWP01_1117 [Myxococcales bacterium]|nr:hypothetical protein [Myxococcales bacterium]